MLFSRKKLRLILISGVLLVLVIVVLLYEILNKSDDIFNVKAQSMDNHILFSWESSRISDVDHVVIRIYSNGEQVEEKEVFDSNMYVFDKGVHGCMYSFQIYAVYKNEMQGKITEGSKLFLNYDQIPDIPLISIQTTSGEDPQYVEAKKTEEFHLGRTQTDNDYLYGMLTYKNAQSIFSSAVKIRTRGNTSCVMFEKKTYKIVFDEPVDMLGMGKAYADTEWVLLNSGCDLKTYLGGYVANLCGVEWQPRLMFVNVMLNNDWKGCYYLVESVKVGETRCNISKSGYLFENDAYYWNEDGIYFQTKNQSEHLGYTFKYPAVKSTEDERFVELESYMQKIEECIIAGSEDYNKYIDVGTFVTWILTRDIMGQGDGAGTNVYYNIYDMLSADSESKKLKMGPLWDFDSALQKDAEFSVQHTMPHFYFAYLFQKEDFYNLYVNKWKTIEQELLSNVEEMYESLLVDCGVALENSRELDGVRWNTGYPSVSEEIESHISWLTQRVKWMNSELKLK